MRIAVWTASWRGRDSRIGEPSSACRCPTDGRMAYADRVRITPPVEGRVTTVGPADVGSEGRLGIGPRASHLLHAGQRALGLGVAAIEHGAHEVKDGRAWTAYIVAADGAAAVGASPGNPGPAERQRRPDQGAPIGGGPSRQVGVPECLGRSSPRRLRRRDQPDQGRPTRELLAHPDVIARRGPDASDRDLRGGRRPEHAVLDGPRSQHRGQGPRVDVAVDVVDHEELRAAEQGREDLLAPLVVLADLGGHRRASAGGDDVDHVDEKILARPGLGGIDEVERGRAVDHRPDIGEQQEGKGIGPARFVLEREVAQEFVQQESGLAHRREPPAATIASISAQVRNGCFSACLR